MVIISTSAVDDSIQAVSPESSLGAAAAASAAAGAAGAAACASAWAMGSKARTRPAAASTPTPLRHFDDSRPTVIKPLPHAVGGSHLTIPPARARRLPLPV